MEIRASVFITLISAFVTDFFPIKDASFRFGERRLETVGGKGDTMISIYCIHSIRQDGKFLIGKAALDVKIKKKQKS